MKRTILVAALAASLTAVATPSLVWAHGQGGPFAAIDATLSTLTTQMETAVADIQALTTTQAAHTTAIANNASSISQNAALIAQNAHNLATQSQQIVNLQSEVNSLTQEVQSLQADTPKTITLTDVTPSGQPFVVGMFLKSVNSGTQVPSQWTAGFMNGVVTFDNVPPGTYSVHAVSPSYQIASPTTITVGGNNPTSYKVTLASDVYDVSGIAENANGTPLGNAAISYRDSLGDDNGYWQTNADGSFNIDDFPPGTYTIQIMPGGFGSPVQASDTFTIPNGGPGVNLGIIKGNQ